MKINSLFTRRIRRLVLSIVMLGSPLVASADVVNINGIYYDLNRWREAEVTSHPNKYFGDVIIPSVVSFGGYQYSVTSIGMNAFSNSVGLTSVSIPSSVTSIGEGAFRYCKGLSSVVIPGNVVSISGGAFDGCSGLATVTIPNSVTFIGPSAFEDCI